MANDVNNNNYSTTPGTILTTDIDTAATRDHTTLFMQSNSTNPEKFSAETTPKIKIDPNY